MAKAVPLMRLLITGSSGKLGRMLERTFPGAYCPHRSVLDVRKRSLVHEQIHKIKPEVMIHAAALTGIRQCEEDKTLAWSTNVEGTENLLKSCIELSPTSYFVYISTACVFYGDRGDYVESDVPHPKNYYSLTKLIAETAVRNSNLRNWLIVRTNFVSREKWPHPGAFTDRFGTYLFADDLARAIAKVIDRGLTGIVHICGNKKLSMYELAKMTSPEVKPMTLTDYAGPPLTVDMTLRSERIEPFNMTPEALERV